MKETNLAGSQDLCRNVCTKNFNYWMKIWKTRASIYIYYSINEVVNEKNWLSNLRETAMGNITWDRHHTDLCPSRPKILEHGAKSGKTHHDKSIYILWNRDLAMNETLG